MRITIACVGKIKEKYLSEGIAEFSKRLTPFCRLDIVSINEEKLLDNSSPAQLGQILEKETQRLLAILPEHAYIIALDVLGQAVSSPELAEKFSALALAGKSHITFVIGGSYGFTDALRRRANERISFSRLTFTHQMIRLLLVEQIYRAFKIMHGETYHK